MGTIIEFLLECFLFGRGGEANARAARTSRGCMFAIVGAFAIVFFTVVVAMWLILKP